MKAFLSYSHSDEHHLQRLKTSLAQIHREGLIDTWHDREIPPGNELAPNIEDNLAESSFFLPLVSPDYLASTYCMEIELPLAIKQNKTIIPIILRDCDWKTSQLSACNALPPDAKPIHSSKDADAAWQSVTLGIRKALQHAYANQVTPQQTEPAPDLTEDFLAFLNDPGTTLLHAHGHHLTLKDIFVYPELERRDSNNDLEANLVTRANQLVGDYNLLVFGDEQSGKTVLAKRLYTDAVKTGFTPIFLNGGELKTSDFTKAKERACQKQYKTTPQFTDLLIIDDLHLSKLNHHGLTKLINSARNEGTKTLLFADQSFRYAYQDIEALADHNLYELLDFNQERKATLIKRWVVCGREDTISESEKFSEIDRIKVQLHDVIGRNLIPSKPIYLLSVLQALETASPTDLQLTSYAHCYHHLIISALARSGAKSSEFDSYVNFLTHLAHHIHSTTENRRLTDDELKKFIETYQESFVFANRERQIETLYKARILKTTESGVTFRDNYIYYFYVAKYLADYTAPGLLLESNIRRLLDDLHIEENANIMGLS
ncbi:MAG: TIR domain-containing protein [Salinisphaeraceae bacterium]